jgi:hypothetical protein
VVVVDNWRRVLILLNLERIVDGGMFHNLTFVITTFLLFLVGCQKLTLLTRWYVLGLMVQ